MQWTHKDLTAYHLSPEQHARTCGYWFTVQCQYMAHTAFVTKKGLERWLEERGLTLERELGDAPDWCRIVGVYRSEAHLHDAHVFPHLFGFATRDMSNGDWVEAIITDDEDGIRTVHTLNPNIRSRKVFDYRESSEMMR